MATVIHVDQRTDRDGNQWTRTANAKPWRGMGGINLTDDELAERGPLTDTSYDVRVPPRRGQFCDEHFSWLCQAGQGQCQRDSGSNPGGAS